MILFANQLQNRMIMLASHKISIFVVFTIKTVSKLVFPLSIYRYTRISMGFGSVVTVYNKIFLHSFGFRLLVLGRNRNLGDCSQIFGKQFDIFHRDVLPCGL